MSTAWIAVPEASTAIPRAVMHDTGIRLELEVDFGRPTVCIAD